MHINKENAEQCWISLIMRVAMASLFGVAAFTKFKMGLGATVGSIQGMFQESWLPSLLVTAYAYAIPFVEALITVWLLSGYKLCCAWVVTSFVLVSLAFGMIVAGQYPIAANNYFYVVMSCVGLYFSRYDCCSVGGKK